MEEELTVENVTPRLFVSYLFDLLQIDIHHVFRDHFQLNDDFEVSFKYRLGIIKRTLVQQNDIDNENNNKMDLNRVNSRRGTVLRQMIRHLSNASILQQTNLELDVINGLRKLFMDKEKTTVNEQLDYFCSTLVEKINNDMIKPVHWENSMEDENKLDDTNDDIEIDKLILINGDINGLEKAIRNDVGHDELDLQIEMGVLNPQI
eukprot:86447_1